MFPSPEPRILRVVKRIYLDHTATTPTDPRVLEAMQPYFSATFGNASSVHWYGRQAKAALEQARGTIAAAIGAEPGEVFFTSGGTESDNLAIRGVAHVARERGRTQIVTSMAEHHAVLETCEQLRDEGTVVTFLPVTAYGNVETQTVREALGPATALVSIMHSNNEVGTLSPVADIAAAAHECGALMHTDAVQSLGKVAVNVRRLDADLMSVSAHKIYGPKGIGALYIRRGADVAPLLRGGGQERGKRPGTENVPLAVGFARAVEIAEHNREEESRRLANLRDLLEQAIREAFPSVRMNGHPLERLPHILNISFDSSKLRMEGEMLLMGMDLKGIAASSGSACTSGSVQPSHVLLAMGRDAETARATLRFSFGRGNAVEDIPVVLEALKEVVGSAAGGPSARTRD